MQNSESFIYGEIGGTSLAILRILEMIVISFASSRKTKYKTECLYQTSRFSFFNDHVLSGTTRDLHHKLNASYSYLIFGEHSGHKRLVSKRQEGP